MKIEFHRLAYQELDDSAEYYDSLSSGLGAEFVATQRSAFEQIMRFSEAWPIVTPEIPHVRFFYTERFGHKVFYRADPGVVYVLAVAHSARKPLYWIDRLES